MAGRMPYLGTGMRLHLGLWDHDQGGLFIYHEVKDNLKVVTLGGMPPLLRKNLNAGKEMKLGRKAGPLLVTNPSLVLQNIFYNQKLILITR